MCPLPFKAWETVLGEHRETKSLERTGIGETSEAVEDVSKPTSFLQLCGSDPIPLRAGKVAQWVKRLLCKSEGNSWDLQYSHRSWWEWDNYETWKVETGESPE